MFTSKRGDAAFPVGAVLGCLAFAIGVPWLMVILVQSVDGDVLAPIADGRWSGFPLLWALIPMALIAALAIGVLVFAAVVSIRTANGRDR